MKLIQTNSSPLRSKPLLKSLLILLLLIDLGYSFLQHFHFPMDGDMGAIIVPAPHYGEVLKDPLGFKVLRTGEAQMASNRFFAHYSMYGYYLLAPHLSSFLENPIDRLYFSAALFKIVVQVLLLMVLGLYLRPFFEDKSLSVLIGMLLISPLFQTKGFHNLMGIIDPSITYTFFYAWPMVLFFLFWYPFYQRWINGKSFPSNWLFRGCYLLLAICLPFSSPIIPPAILLVMGLMSVQFIQVKYRDGLIKSIPGFFKHLRTYWTPFGFTLYCCIGFWALYSFVLGYFNLENQAEQMPILDRYDLLVQGILRMISAKIALPILIVTLVIQVFLSRRMVLMQDVRYRQLLSLMNWFLAFSLLYILLLPLGGYRSYRPYIIRRDTIMPILLGAFLLYALSTYLLLQAKQKNIKALVLSLALLVSILFSAADQTNFSQNKCERSALKTLSNTPKEEVLLPKDCLLMSWQNLGRPYQSQWNAIVIQRFGVTDRPIWYSNEE